MTEPFTGQIEIYGFGFAPSRWAFAAGQTLAIQQNTALFSLIGATYGGSGTTTFQLPNLASRQACGSGTGPGLTDRVIGEPFGDFSVSLTVDEMPMHNHGMNIFVAAPDPTPAPTTNSTIGVPGSNYAIYAAPGTSAQMSPMMVQPIGGNLPHNNLQPFLALNYCIALQGNFPSWN